VLWIWDNVEPVTGFPAGTTSDWSDIEQQELRAFLSAARETKAKFLLTSRRDEMAWLGELPRRVAVPDMPMQERFQLAGAIVERRGRRLAELPELTPLLRFTRGNPLTIIVTLGEALRAGIDTPEQLNAFVAALRRGEAAFEDEASEGRSKSLGASLSYGFDTAFTDDERKVLALLHLFQGFVDVDMLRMMGDPEAEWCLAAVRGLTRERGIALLDRAAEIGLLHAHGSGVYGIHPALPWYFRVLFSRDFPEDGDDASRAFVEVMGRYGDFCQNAYLNGSHEHLSAVMLDEDNLLAAWRIARARGLWRAFFGVMQGLSILYGPTGRGTAWRRLVNDAVVEFIDPSTDGPLSGREEYWSLVTDYRVRVAAEDRNLVEAERLQRIRVDGDRQRTQLALATAPDQRDTNQRHAISELASSIRMLGEIELRQGSPTCAAAFREALDLCSAIDHTAAQAVCAYSLGVAYQQIPDLRNLGEAERWYRKGLDLRAPDDGFGRGQCVAQLGQVAYERFLDLLTAKRPGEERAPHLAEAWRLYEQALDMMPATAVIQRGNINNQLGLIYDHVGDIDRALHNYRQGIQYHDKAGDIIGAGRCRHNVAIALAGGGRLTDARVYAEAALANFQTFGDRAANEIQMVEGLIAKIDRTIAEKGGGV
jgi:tetratricopeptide (TPR) repeat protein